MSTIQLALANVTIEHRSDGVTLVVRRAQAQSLVDQLAAQLVFQRDDPMISMEALSKAKAELERGDTCRTCVCYFRHPSEIDGLCRWQPVDVRKVPGAWCRQYERSGKEKD